MPFEFEHVPPEHPELPVARTGILLTNLGTPDSYRYWPMRRYLSEFLSDRRVIDYSPLFWQPLLQLVILSRRPFSSGQAYRSIWNEEDDESPLMTITRAQTVAISERMQALYGDSVMVDFAMRYGNPDVRSRLHRMVAAGCRRILYFPLYPQYAAATTATACDQLFRALMRERWQPTLRVAAPYFDRPDYVAALARSVTDCWSAAVAKPPEKLVCSYHGLPSRYLTEGDPYHCHCQKTTRLLREHLGWPEAQITTTFQSRFGPEEWLQPYTAPEVARLAREDGVRRLAVIAPAFSADCIETLEEIRGEIRDSFLEAGGEEFTYIPCLNADTDHINMLCSVIEDNLAGWLPPRA